MLLTKDRKSRLSKKADGAAGFLTTNFKFGMLGTVGGIIFRAQFEIKNEDLEASIDCEFLVRPVTDREVLKRGRWIEKPVLPDSEGDPANN
jgi:hypothetical protein